MTRRERFARWYFRPTRRRVIVSVAVLTVVYALHTPHGAAMWKTIALLLVQLLTVAVTHSWLLSMSGPADVQKQVEREVAQWRASAAFDAFQQVRKEYAAKMGRTTPAEKEWKA